MKSNGNDGHIDRCRADEDTKTFMAFPRMVCPHWPQTISSPGLAIASQENKSGNLFWEILNSSRNTDTYVTTDMVEIQAFPISLFMSVMLGLVAPQREGWDKYFALFTQVSRWYPNPLLSHSWELHIAFCSDYQQVFCRICKSNTYCCSLYVGPTVYSSELLIPKPSAESFLRIAHRFCSDYQQSFCRICTLLKQHTD